jgi:hypothetical protein
MTTYQSNFKVVSVSCNTNSFGLTGVILADKTGLAFEVAMNALSKPAKGDDLIVTLDSNNNLQSIAGKSYELPRKVARVPSEILKELFPDIKKA